VDELQGEFIQRRVGFSFAGKAARSPNSAKSKAQDPVTQPKIRDVWSCVVQCAGLRVCLTELDLEKSGPRQIRGFDELGEFYD
jgi:hypothetical protein